MKLSKFGVAKKFKRYTLQFTLAKDKFNEPKVAIVFNHFRNKYLLYFKNEYNFTTVPKSKVLLFSLIHYK